MDKIDCAVIGAGVVGLAVARTLALAGREVFIIEREGSIGSMTSARNSEVIHAGIHYPQYSGKARLCVAGARLLYDYCTLRHVPHRRCGKLIVATCADELPRLATIRDNAAGNGVSDLQLLTAQEVQTLEPEIDCIAALLSPATGIVDSHALMQAFLADAQHHNALLAVQSRVIAAIVRADGIRLDIECANGDRTSVSARSVVNAAGLYAPAMAMTIQGFPAAKVPHALFAKGNYYSLAGSAPFSRLVYPLPEPGGLGLHYTLDLGHQARFGPDVEWLAIVSADEIDYNVDTSRVQQFYSGIRKYWPGLPDGALLPAYSGVRPKIAATGVDADFMIQGPADHGISGLVNLFGIESPGLTSAMAIAQEVQALLA
jgi:L-2-hydroxyglutarate oxidase LhgO